MIIFSVVIMLTLPAMINIFIPDNGMNVDGDQILEDYYAFTGQDQKATKESVWVLTGVYTPYQGGYYQYTQDGWLYGSRVDYLRPSQYEDTQFAFDVKRNAQGIYEYASDSRDYTASGTTTYTTIGGSTITVTGGTGHKAGDLYTSVSFDKEQMSDIFFSKAAKYDSDGNTYTTSGEPFYYEYTGYRYAFQPTKDTVMVDGDGHPIDVTYSTTSLSLIWYQYYTANGIAGQLVLSGNDSGVAYLTGDQIVKAFDSTTSTARFDMTFNAGVQMGIYIKIDPWYLSEGGYTVKQCYDAGYWSIMVTSQTTDSNAYTGTDFSLNIYNIFDTLIDLMTFNYADYGFDELIGMICSFVIIIPLYAGLIALAINSIPVLVFTAILGVVQSIAAIMSNWSFLF